MNERIKLIRKKNHLSQELFGERLRITKASVSRIESGINNPSDQTVKLICSEFKINEEWLRNGIGEMDLDVPEEDQIADMVYDLLGDNKNSFHELIIEIMRTYKELSPGSQEVINEYVSKLLDNIAQKKGD